MQIFSFLTAAAFGAGIGGWILGAILVIAVIAAAVLVFRGHSEPPAVQDPKSTHASNPRTGGYTGGPHL